MIGALKRAPLCFKEWRVNRSERVYSDAGYTGMWKYLDARMPWTPTAVLPLMQRHQEDRRQSHANVAAGDREVQGQHPLQGVGQEPSAAIQSVRTGQFSTGDMIREPS